MKAFHLLAMSAAIAGLPIISATEAGAQQRAVVGGPRNNFSSHGGQFHGGMHGGRFHRGFNSGFLVVDREVPVYVDSNDDANADARAVAPVAPAAPAPPRKPYVIGSTYASLPSGCMKMIDEGVSYYYCGGDEWYKQTGKQYRAVARKL